MTRKDYYTAKEVSDLFQMEWSHDGREFTFNWPPEKGIVFVETLPSGNPVFRRGAEHYFEVQLPTLEQ
jgi:hypothetical protein